MEIDGVHDSLQRSTKYLEDSYKLLGETEEIGDKVCLDLGNQREQLVDSHEKVMETRSFTKDARKMLISMRNNEMRVRFVILCLWCFILFQPRMSTRFFA
mmetsp:Transcript_43015/g.58725  ORF Transcript_43015/g.58725 Transcript_43015/m.58725 type:complete len:100 (-) Transcript_43015:911-1210(-)